MGKIASRNALGAAAIAILAALGTQARAADPFVADSAADTGAEPNPQAPTAASPDIWVRRAPDPNYNAAPFNAANPPWTPQPNQSARHADPRFSAPNWVYVRIRNRGPGATPADARLKLYWTKTGGNQNWPTAWNDYFPAANPTVLFGMEITKPRRNAATVSQAERDAYVRAILAIDTPSHSFPGGVTFWDKQNEIHSNDTVMPAAHRNPAFLPWHREFLNRYEALLQTAEPTLKLLYWDWQQDPRQPINGFSYFSTSFMGAIGQGATTPVRAPFIPLMTPVQVVRNGRAPGDPFGTRPDGPVFARAQYHDVSGTTGVRSFIEGGPRHNRAHVDIGGPQPTTCETQPATCVQSLSYVAQAVRDPFFFLLHGNVDRLWAQWQRADPQRYDSRSGATPYGLDSTNPNITRTMPPWDGSAGIAPWTPGSPELRAKTSLDPSVVSPPIYDTAPLTIPVLQAGQAAIIQIPWYPPNPQAFAGISGSPQSFALLARIETSTTPPFGMTTPEGSNIAANIRNNNKIARRNVTVQPPAATLAAVAAPAAISSRSAAPDLESLSAANDFDEPVTTALGTSADSAPLELTLPEKIRARWDEGGARGEGVKILPDGRLEIAPGGKLDGLLLEPGEAFDFEVRARGGVAELIQFGTPAGPDDLVISTEVEPAGADAAGRAARGAPEAPRFVRAGERLTIAPPDLGDPALIESVTLLVDGKPVATRNAPPFTFDWRGDRIGGHDLQVQVTDKTGAVTAMSRVVTVAENLPPAARLLAPADQAMFPAGAPVPVAAEASDPDGKVARVDFYLSNMAVFTDPVLVASVKAAPYATRLKSPGVGMWMLAAVAVDDKGIESQSLPIHFMVHAAQGAKP